MRAIVLHAYSAGNLGDGLLVEETLKLLKEALGNHIDITVAALHPESFKDLPATVLKSGPTFRGYDKEYIRTLQRLNDFDIVIGVGGGYLRARRLSEAVKTALVHGPQLMAASRHGSKAIYLPQSIGPMHFGLRSLVESRLRRLRTVFLRDARSIEEFPGAGGIRVPDLATGTIKGPDLELVPNPTPVLSVRSVYGRVPPKLYELASLLQPFDGYIQSTSSGNDDRPAAATFAARRNVDREELIEPGGFTPRVVVAVRLHAALMALRAGHYVVHLAYERKGFGAFTDLGLDEYVHNVNDFCPSQVAAQIEAIRSEPSVRADYLARIDSTNVARTANRLRCLDEIRGVVGMGSPW